MQVVADNAIKYLALTSIQKRYIADLLWSSRGGLLYDGLYMPAK